MRAWWWIAGLLVLAGVWAWWHGLRLPPRYIPWAPLQVSERLGPFTRYKIARLAAHPLQCRALLRRFGADFSVVADRGTGRGCGWHDAVRLAATGQARLSRPTLVTCPLAVSMAEYDRRVLQPQARSMLGRAVVRIDHVGSYACRHVYHRARGRLSRHARAQAVDVTGVRLAGGRRIVIGRDWHGDDAAGRYLHRVAQRACRIFGMTLTPDYNAAHHSHFHLQRPGGGWCP